MLQFKIFCRYTGFWIFFTICFAIMFTFLVAAVMGITSGLMLAVLGTAIIMFKANFIISELAPEIMLFGGLCGAFFTAFLGVTAIKIGFIVSKLFLRVRRRCDKLRESCRTAQVPIVSNETNEHIDEPADETDDVHEDEHSDEQTNDG